MFFVYGSRTDQSNGQDAQNEPSWRSAALHVGRHPDGHRRLAEGRSRRTYSESDMARLGRLITTCFGSPILRLWFRWVSIKPMALSKPILF